MFAGGVLPALVFMALLLRIPESPRWLNEQNRAEEAGRVLEKVGGAAYAQAEWQSFATAWRAPPEDGANCYRPHCDTRSSWA
jgi:hypothetical protein